MAPILTNILNDKYFILDWICTTSFHKHIISLVLRMKQSIQQKNFRSHRLKLNDPNTQCPITNSLNYSHSQCPNTNLHGLKKRSARPFVRSFALRFDAFHQRQNSDSRILQLNFFARLHRSDDRFKMKVKLSWAGGTCVPPSRRSQVTHSMHISGKGAWMKPPSDRKEEVCCHDECCSHYKSHIIQCIIAYSFWMRCVGRRAARNIIFDWNWK